MGGSRRIRSFLHGLLRSAGSQSAPVALVIGLILTGLTVFLLIRLGLLALVASYVFGICFLEPFP